MAITIDGSSGIASVDGSAGSPSSRGTDANSGVYYAADTVSISTAGSERVQVDSNGDLGLGTAPNNFGSYKTLHIKGPSGEGAAIRLQDNGDTADSNDFAIYKNSAAAYLRVNGTDPIIYYQNGAEKARFKSDGDWQINGDNVSTTNGLVGQTYKFFASDNNLNIGFETPTQDRSAIFERRRTGRSGNARLSQINLYENSSAEGGVSVYPSDANSDISGGVYIVDAATSWSGISDIRLKDKTGDITNALTDIAKIETLKFTWKSDTKKRPKVGVTAQSVESIVPEAIHKGKSILLSEKGDDTEYMSVRYTELIPLCIEAIKEAKTKIETLEAKVAALEAA